MGRGNVMKSFRGIAVKAVLLTATVAPMVSAYAQQEVNATWYDPWATASKADAQQVQKKSTEPKNHLAGSESVATRKGSKLVQVRAETTRRADTQKPELR